MFDLKIQFISRIRALESLLHQNTSTEVTHIKWSTQLYSFTSNQIIHSTFKMTGPDLQRWKQRRISLVIHSWLIPRATECVWRWMQVAMAKVHTLFNMLWLMRGRYDDALCWPFKTDLQITLLNQITATLMWLTSVMPFMKKK